MKLNDDEFYIKRTFELALNGLGTTWPNPLVGSVIVKDGRIIGEGFHLRPGQDHAELAALKNCKESAQGATVYVNLEPCCHTNKLTPPCAQRLIQEKIKRVVICNLDPNPQVNGKGVELLRTNGIEVSHGILQAEGERLNEVFFHAQKTKRPFVYLKMASTLDGKMAMNDGESKWITGPLAREHVHLLRSQHQAIMVGAETVRQDNPKLNVRLDHYAAAQPYRIVFTHSGKLPQDANILNDELKERTLVFTSNEVSFKFPTEQIIRIKSVEEALHHLFERKIINIFLEGGPNLASFFMKQNLINRIGLFMNPSFLGTGISMLQDIGVSDLNGRPRLQDVSSEWFGEDLFITGSVCSRD